MYRISVTFAPNSTLLLTRLKFHPTQFNLFKRRPIEVIKIELGESNI
ncbi:MAG: hypothetical protein ACI3ZG_01295 [Candidatus Coprenecus sp.]